MATKDYLNKNGLEYYHSKAKTEFENVLNQDGTVSATGSSIEIDNGLEEKLADLTVYGNTEQNGTPTPESPVDVEVVTGRNEVNIKGKNLFDNTLTPSGLDNATASSTNTGIKVTSTVAGTGSYTARFVVLNISNKLGQTMTLSSDIVCSSSNYGRYAVLLCDKNEGNRNYITGKSNLTTGRQELTITIPTTVSDNNEYLMIALYSNSGSTSAVGDYVEYNNLQLEFGSTTTLYEPNQSNTYEIDLGSIELCKIGDYKDKIYKENNKWYLRKEIDKIILNGTENWNIMLLSSSKSVFRYGDRTTISMFLKNLVGNGVTELYSDYYISNYGMTGYQTLDNGGYGITIAYGIRGNSSTIDANNGGTVEQWKALLSTNNLYIYGVLATPTTTEITNTELISQLEAISTLTGKNYIDLDCVEGNALASVAITAYTNSVNGKYESLKNNSYTKDEIDTLIENSITNVLESDY